VSNTGSPKILQQHANETAVAFASDTTSSHARSLTIRRRIIQVQLVRPPAPGSRSERPLSVGQPRIRGQGRRSSKGKGDSARLQGVTHQTLGALVGSVLQPRTQTSTCFQSFHDKQLSQQGVNLTNGKLQRPGRYKYQSSTSTTPRKLHLCLTLQGNLSVVSLADVGRSSRIDISLRFGCKLESGSGLS